MAKVSGGPAGGGNKKPANNKSSNNKSNNNNKGNNKSPKDKDGKDSLSRQELAANYGFAMAFLKSDKELWKLFKQAVSKTWTSQMFVAKLRNTDWFKKNSASVRNAIMQETADPATYKQNVQQMLATVRDSWGKMFGPDGRDAKQLKAWAETAVRMGWSEAQLQDQLTKSVNYQKLLKRNELGGTAAQLNQQLDTMIKAYGSNASDNWKARQLQQIMSGNNTIEGAQERLRQQAMHQYAAFADRIAGGETVQDIADPYMQTMADLLEIAPGTVTVQDKMIQSALRRKDDQGKPAALDLYSFADMVRKDERWQYTDNAKKQVYSIGTDLLKSFGLMA